MGWSMIVPIIGIPVAVAASAGHTSKVNEQIAQDFAAKSFPGGVIMPQKEISGFLFFNTEEEHGDLSGLSLEILATDIETGDRVTITMPLPPVVTGKENRNKNEN